MKQLVSSVMGEGWHSGEIGAPLRPTDEELGTSNCAMDTFTHAITQQEKTGHVHATQVIRLRGNM